MRLALLFIFTIILSLPAKGQVLEKYFHELRGMEDSTGTTHLFYRFFRQNTSQCSAEYGSTTLTSTYNNVYHYDTESFSDSVKFYDYYNPWCLDGYYNTTSTGSYIFLGNDPAKSINTTFGDYCSGSLESYIQKHFPFYYPCFIKQAPSITPLRSDDNGLIYDFHSGALFTFFGSLDSHIQLSANIDEWPVFDSEDYEGFEDSTGVYFEFLDSTKTGFELIAIHPQVESIYYGKSITDSLKASSFEIIIPDLNVNTLRFDSNPSVVYSIYQDGTRKLAKSDNYGRTNSWIDLALPIEFGILQFIETDIGTSGSVFIADTNSVYQSSDYGNSFELLIEMEYQITGLYKKPDSELLYVLTTDELFELNIESGTTTSLKTLPVSNEQEPADLPNQVILHQNYPNPFNPSTNIMYALPSDTYVELKVYDRLGREIQFLVNEYQTKGVYSVRFRTHDLASGVYFYQLIARDLGEVHSKKMYFIK